MLKGYPIDSATTAFVAWLAEEADPFISPLSVVEFRCVIRRRERAGQLTRRRSKAILERLQAHLVDQSLGWLAWRDRAFRLGDSLIDRVDPISLRAPDALHPSIALQHRCACFATADRVQAEVADRLGFVVRTIFPPA